MITGFNTDIEFEGITYHVQTEDKGLDNPLILSLVYVGGAILASKRTPYTDLLDSGFDENILTERLNRQHKLICAAVRSGRIEDLKRLNEGDAHAGTRRAARPKAERAAKPKSEAVDAPAAVPVEQAVPDAVELKPPGSAAHQTPLAVDAPPAPVVESKPSILDLITDYNDPVASEVSQDTATPLTLPSPPEPLPPAYLNEPVLQQEPEKIAEPVASVAEEEAEELYLSLLDDEGDFRAGELVTVRIRVGRGKYGRVPIPEAAVTVKVLGTTFRPLILSTLTDDSGIAVVRALLPRFTSGRAAILIRAVVEGEDAELRRIIHQG